MIDDNRILQVYSDAICDLNLGHLAALQAIANAAYEDAAKAIEANASIEANNISAVLKYMAAMIRALKG